MAKSPIDKNKTVLKIIPLVLLINEVPATITPHIEAIALPDCLYKFPNLLQNATIIASPATVINEIPAPVTIHAADINTNVTAKT